MNLSLRSAISSVRAAPHAIGRAIDTFISPFAPELAVRRAMARRRYQVIQRKLDRLRKSEAGAPDRTSARRRHPLIGPVEATRRDIVSTRAQARELFRKNPYARGVTKSLVAHIVGCGISPQPNVLMKGDSRPNQKFHEQALELWDTWSKRCDMTGRKRFAKILRQAKREEILVGEAFLVFSAPADDRAVPLALELVTSERVAFDLDQTLANKNEIIQGIEFTPSGQIVNYWIYPQNPYEGRHLRLGQPTPVEASRVLHLIDEDEPGQVRGLTRFLSVAGTCEATLQWLDWVLTKERVASAFALMHKSRRRNVGVLDNEDSEEDEDGNLIEDIEGGMLIHGKPEDELVGVSSGVQAANVSELKRVLDRQLARGMDVPYPESSADYSQVTYLSARSETIAARKIWEPEQDDLVETLCQPVWERFIMTAILARKLQIPNGADPLRYCGCVWVPDGEDWIDPSKDGQADIQGLQAGIKSPLEVISRAGGTWRKIVQDLRLYKEELEAAGIQSATIFNPPGVAALPAPDSEEKPADPGYEASPEGAAAAGKGDEGEADPKASGADAGTPPRQAAPDLRSAIDAYGIAVRAGVITPQEADEDHFRGLLGLPSKGPAVGKAWSQDEGARRPITLTPPAGASATGSVAAAEATKQSTGENVDGDQAAA